MKVILTKREDLFSQIQYYTLLLIVFLMPFSREAIPPFIIVWFVLWLMNGKIKEKTIAVFKSKYGIVLISFYILHLIGMLYTSNLRSGKFDLEVKLSLLIFPLLMFGSSTLIGEKFYQLLTSFIVANFISSTICFIIDIPNISSGNYFYNVFSLFLHPTYGSMYVLFCICILLYFLFENKIPQFNKISQPVIKSTIIFLLLFFSITIYFYSSRAGLLSFAAISVIAIYYFLQRWKINKIIKMSSIIGMIVLMFLIINKNSRFEILTNFIHSKEKINYKTTENISIRYLITLEAIDLIRKNLLLGVGTGDIKDILMESYHTKGFDEAIKENLNVHNQFLESTLGLGITGGVLLLAIVLLPLIKGIKTKNILLIFFTLIIFINFLFESMLNLQIGVVFYSFFNTLLLVRFQKEDNQLITH